MLQANTRSPGYGCYCIKYKQRWDGVKIAVSNTGNIHVHAGVHTERSQGKQETRWWYRLIVSNTDEHGASGHRERTSGQKNQGAINMSQHGAKRGLG